MLSRKGQEDCSPFKCPYGCGAEYQKRWQAKRHAKADRCSQSQGLSQEERESALALLHKPQKKMPFCEVCGVELTGHRGLEVHNASAAHFAKLRDAPQVRRAAEKSIEDVKEPEEGKQTRSQQEASGLSASADPDINAAWPPTTTFNDDQGSRILPRKRPSRSEEGQEAGRKRTRKHARIACDCGSIHRAGDHRAHLTTQKHKAWVEEEAVKAQKAITDRECAEMANEDILGKFAPLLDTEASRPMLLKLFKERAFYGRDAAEVIKELLPPEAVSGLERDDNVSNEEIMVAAPLKSYRERFEEILAHAVAVHRIQEEFRLYAETDTTEMSKEQAKHVKRNYEHRYRFDGNIMEAKSRGLCFVAVMTSCFPPRKFVKTQSEEASDKRRRLVKRQGRPFRQYKTTCKIIDRSCSDQPQMLHLFSRDVDRMPTPLRKNQICLIAVHKGRASFSNKTGTRYLSASDYSSWVVFSLTGHIELRAGKPFCPFYASLTDMLLLARGMQSEHDNEARLQKALKSDQADQLRQMCEPVPHTLAQGLRPPMEGPDTALQEIKRNEKEISRSHALTI